MNAALIILRVCVAPLQQQLRRSSSSVAAAAPSQQHYNLALKWSTHRLVPSRGAASSTSRRDAVAPRGGTRDAAAAQHQLRRSSTAAPSQHEQQATAVSRDDERSMGTLLWKVDGGFSCRIVPPSQGESFTRSVHRCY